MKERLESFTVQQAGAADLIITSAPPRLGQTMGRIAALLKKIVVTRNPNTISWDELREIGAAYKIIIDPRDVHHPEDYDHGWNADRWEPQGARDMGLVR